MRNEPKLRFNEFTKEYELKKIGSISSRITAGGTPSTKELKYWKNGTIPWMSSGEVNKRILYDTDKKISEEGLMNSSTKMIKNQSVLMALAGQGKTRGMVAVNEISLCTNQSIGAIEVNENEQDYKYLFYNLFKEYEKLRIWSSTGEGRGGINLKFISDWKLNIPLIQEQKKVSSFLDVVDSKITLLEDKLKNLKLFKSGLVQREFTYSNYEKVKLKKLITESSIRNKELLINRVLSITNSRGFINQEEMFDRSVASSDISTYKIVRKGQFGYNPSRINVGSIDLLESYNEGVLSPIYVVFSCDELYLNSNYMEYWFESHSFKGYMKKYIEGGVRDTLSFKNLSDMSIPLPNIENQKAFLSKINPFMVKINCLEAYLETLKQFKKGLLQQMFI